MGSDDPVAHAAVLSLRRDFTLDDAEWQVGKWASLLESPMWDEDWFGSANQNTDLRTMTSGRWAYLSLPRVDVTSSVVRNSYGYLRAPWNNNRRPYITRSHDQCGYVAARPLPTCEAHLSVVRMQTWDDFGMELQYSAHGNTHIFLGGQVDWCVSFP